MEFFSKKNIETLPHAPYSLNLAPCDFWLFPQLKTRLAGQRFDNEEGLKQGVQGVLGQFCQGGLLHVFESWMERMQKFIDVGGIHGKMILIKFFLSVIHFKKIQLSPFDSNAPRITTN